ncbi:MAG TPA: sigma-70 family RNA polymerase sigma factor [Terriglobales bacterium]|nr:sigma-70 family RNA polymerase sigma factor [Terriglobales bacterium]
MPDASNQVTQLLVRWREGDEQACDQLFPLVYQELRRLARHCLSAERSDHTLQSTALVHEAYLRLVGNDTLQTENRVHFFALAAQVMRRVLVDHARKRLAGKRGGKEALTVTLSEAIEVPRKQPLDVMALDTALHELARVDQQQAQIVEMRFFAGLSIDETSQALGISPATVKRDWTMARAWLYRQLQATEA